MIKKTLIHIMLLALVMTAAGCSNAEKPADDSTPVTPVPQNKMTVVDRNGDLLGEINGRAECSACNAGIFYSVFELGENQYTATAEYRFFSKNDNTDVLLGQFEEQGYEAYFTRTELNGCIYTLAIKGPVSADSSPLMLLAFDPGQKTMKIFTVSESGFPYADMAAVNGKMLIMNHEMSGKKEEKIYEFDPADETLKEVLSFSSEKDSLRGICAADSGFYLLRLKINGGENEMFVDHYGNDYGKTSEQSVNEAMINAIMPIPGMSGRQDVLNEMGMYVLNFSVVDGRYMFYENFSVSRIIIDLQSQEALLSKEDFYSVSSGNGRPVVYRIDWNNEDIKDPEIIGLENGQLVNHTFKPIDSHRLVRSISRSASGTWVAVTSDDYRAFCWTQAVHLWTESE